MCQETSPPVHPHTHPPCLRLRPWGLRVPPRHNGSDSSKGPLVSVLSSRSTSPLSTSAGCGPRSSRNGYSYCSPPCHRVSGPGTPRGTPRVGRRTCSGGMCERDGGKGDEGRGGWKGRRRRLRPRVRVFVGPDPSTVFGSDLSRVLYTDTNVEDPHAPPWTPVLDHVFYSTLPSSGPRYVSDAWGRALGGRAQVEVGSSDPHCDHLRTPLPDRSLT